MAERPDAPQGESLAVSETTTNQRAACAGEGNGNSAKAKGPQDNPAAAHPTLLSATGAQPVVWRIRLGDSDTWGYCDTESDADFHIKQSGLAGVKQPLYAAPPVEAGAQTDAARYAWIREFVASHLLHYILRGWMGGMGNYDPDMPPDLIHECNERKRNELDAEIDAIRFQYETGE